MSDIQELLKIKEHVDKSKVERERLIGQREQILKQLEGEFGCPTLESAQSYLNELTTEAARLEKEVTEGLAVIKEELGWT